MANERCWYCDQLGVVDHKHGTGHSCGDCCATHGGLTKDMEVYNWVKDCIAAKNAHIAELETQLAEAQKAAEIADAQLHRISQWCEAYPLDVFPKPDMKEVQRLLGDTLLTQLSSHNMRHVVEGVAKIIKRPKEKP